MAELYEVTAHSITTSPTKGIRHDGVEELAFRHWFAGALVEIEKTDAESLVKHGAIRASSKSVPKK
jgi:hypothetical protein